MNYSLINEVWNTNNIKKIKEKKISESFFSSSNTNNDINNNDNIDKSNSINDENSCNTVKNCDDYIKHIFSCKKCLKKIKIKIKSEINESENDLINNSNIKTFEINENLNELFEINKDLISVILLSTIIVLFIQSIKNKKN